MNKSLLLISSSRPNRQAPYFSHAREWMEKILAGKNQLLFIPYAAPGGISHANYTQNIAKAFAENGLPQKVVGIESFHDPISAIQQAEAVFTGGGNTFLLLKTMYDKGLMKPLKDRIEAGMPYLGSSAGSNLAGQTINNSNDMPIIFPPSFDALGVIPFNINPHHPRKESEQHSGETRRERIQEYLALPQKVTPVISMYESSMLVMQNGKLTLEGIPHPEDPGAWLFEQGKEAVAIQPGEELEF